MKNKVNALLKKIVRLGLLNDRSEYDAEDLQSTYDLTEAEAAELFTLIQQARQLKN